MDVQSLPDTDWQSARPVLACNRYMLENQIECDVHFTLISSEGDSVRLRAHKFVLISRSPVFFAMLSGPLAERNEEIKVTDICSEAFKEMLKFLYFEELDLSPDIVFSVLYAAKKYLVTSLARHCSKYLASILSAENVCDFLENSFLFEEDEELRSMCTDIVRQKTKTVFSSDAFCQMSADTLCKVLAVDSLSLQEVDVFRACALWAERQCVNSNVQTTAQNKRQVLGEALKLVHFPALSLSEFTKIVVPTEILSTEEENLIFRFLLQKGEAGPKPAVVDDFPFPTRSRERVAVTCQLQYHGGYLKHTTSYSSLFQGMAQRSKWHVTFAVDHTIHLKEIGFTGTFKGTVAVVQNGNRKLEVTCQAHVQSITFSEEETVSLDAGLFTVASDSPFAFVGDYYSKGLSRGESDPAPSVECDQNKVTLVAKDCTTLSFLDHLVFVPTDDMNFVEDYFAIE